MADAYKARKEAFVSNLTGGSSSEIVRVTLVAASSMLLWSALQSRQRFFDSYTPPVLAVDLLLNCVAILLATTQYSSIPGVLNLLLILPAGLTFLYPPLPAKQAPQRKSPNRESEKDADSTASKDPFPVKPFLTNYRGSMMVITCTSILAVDFPVFPRRFAKVETWGTSMMDLGVGSFVFSAGLVAARSVLKDQSSKNPAALGKRLAASLRHSIPLLVLGLIRLYSVKGLDYAEHVTEYGVHWNFFFTLAFLPPFVALFQSQHSLLPSFAARALILAVCYELLLDYTSLTTYIVSAPRDNLISQNREGIFSFIGYLSIFLAGQATGMYALPRSTPAAPPSTSSPSTFSSRIHRFRRTTLGQLLTWSAIWTTLYAATTSYQGLRIPVSRRLANLPYFLWVSAYNTAQLALMCQIEQLFFPDLYSASTRQGETRRIREATSRVLRAFNRNGLTVFLVANLGTGAVNLTVKTLEVGDGMAVGILVGYIAGIAAVAVALDWVDVSVKL